jgi:hypothetical protein
VRSRQALKILERAAWTNFRYRQTTLRRMEKKVGMFRMLAENRRRFQLIDLQGFYDDQKSEAAVS